MSGNFQKHRHIYQPNTTNRTHCPGRMFGLCCTMHRVQFGSCLLKRNPSHTFCKSVAMLGHCTPQVCKANTRLGLEHLGTFQLGTVRTLYRKQKYLSSHLNGTDRCHNRRTLHPTPNQIDPHCRSSIAYCLLHPPYFCHDHNPNIRTIQPWQPLY